MNELTLAQPDDWHLHLRDGDLLAETVSATARCFRRAIVMPNLVPPVVNKTQALEYRKRILQHVPKTSHFEPLLTLFLTDQTTAKDIKEAAAANIVAAKLYPAGATTHSDSAVGDIKQLYPVFEAMSQAGMLLLVHGEVTNSQVDIFDREKRFIDDYLIAIHEHFAELKVVFEHITTSDAVDFVKSASKTLAATITPQHLLLNRNDLLAGGIHPHNYCLPVLKRNSHQQALREAVKSGSSKFFLGSDSAPHEKTAKENACGCAGCYSALGAIELYASVFDEIDALDKLEGFASHHGADFYGLARNESTITLRRKPWTVPDQLVLSSGKVIVPFFAGQTLDWKLSKVNNRAVMP